MDEHTRQEQHEKFNTKNQEDSTNNRTNLISHCTIQKNEKARSRSRSRSPNTTKGLTNWISSNAFINFVLDFKENHSGMSSTKVLQLAGEKWKQMLPNEKQPYVEAAKNIKSHKQDQQKKEHVNNPNQTNIEPKKGEKGRQTKNVKSTKKSQRNNKEKKQKKKKKYNTESESDSVISVTSATSLTSEDLTDLSS